MAKLKFGGEEYEYVELTTLTLDEALVLHQYSGLTLDEVPDAGFHPGVIMALIHISVARGNPRIKYKDLREAVGQTTYQELNDIFEDVATETEEKEEADRPPASAAPSGDGNEPDEQPKNDSSPTISGAGSEASTENPASNLRAIGNPGLEEDVA